MIVVSQTTVAQEIPNFAVIRKNQLADIDRRTVDGWVTKQIEQLFAADEPTTAHTIGNQFCKTVITHFKANDATDAFKKGIAQIVANAFNNSYKDTPVNANPQRSIALTYGLTALKEFAQPIAMSSFVRVLTDPIPGARFLAAEGLLSIHNNIKDEDWKNILDHVSKTAGKETNPLILEKFYRLIGVNTGPRVADAMPIMAKIIDSRFIQFEKNGKLPTQADAEAVVWLVSKSTTITNPQSQNNITLQAARLLADAIYAYLPLLEQKTDEKKKKKNLKLELQKKQFELIIESMETQLKNIVAAKLPGKQRPDITNAILEGGASRDKQMMAELNKWIGNAQTKGLLNDPPFGFQPGLGIQRPKPAATAPAEK
jgi:hypothetical protein